jgi:hypothetical protein
LLAKQYHDIRGEQHFVKVQQSWLKGLREHTQMPAYIPMCIHMYMGMYMHMYIHMCMHMYMHMYIRMYMHAAPRWLHVSDDMEAFNKRFKGWPGYPETFTPKDFQWNFLEKVFNQWGTVTRSRIHILANLQSILCACWCEETYNYNYKFM